MEKKFVFKWSDELAFNFIKFRAENEHRNASSQGYDEIIKIMGLEGKVTQQRCKKKWENLKKKYKLNFTKDLTLPKTGSGTDAGEVTAASWIVYAAMHEAIGQRPSVRPVYLFSSGHSSVERAQTPVSEVDVEANCPTGSSTDTETKGIMLGSKSLSNKCTGC